MTIETTANRISYTGSGTTGPFSFPYYFLADGDLTVIKTTIADGTEATLTLTTDYTVSGAGEAAGGSVTLVATLSSSYKLTIIRDPDILQPADYPANDRFPAATHEEALDRATMILQRLKDLIDRSFRLSDGDVSGISLILSNLGAGKLIAVNSAGDGIESIAAADVDLTTVSAFIQTLLDDADAATARVTLGAAATGANTFTGDQTLGAGVKLIFEGTTADDYETTVDPGEPTADRTLTLPNKSGTLVTIGDIVLAQDFRLTLTTGVPVTISDVTAASTLYCTPYKGNRIALYDGAAWNVRTSAEFSLALSGLTSGKPYDVFCYDNAGTPTLEFLVWTNDTTRATALAYQDGVLVKSGAATRRYLGTFYTTGTTTTEDSVANRYLWNYYHRADRPMLRNETTATWTYTTNTWRQANNAAANQLNFIVGVAEESVFAKAVGAARNSAAQQTAYVGIGLDATNANSATLMPAASIFSSATHFVALNAEYLGMPAAGRHYLAWLEIDVTATNTTTWAGTQDSSKSGIQGSVRG